MNRDYLAGIHKLQSFEQADQGRKKVCVASQLPHSLYVLFC